MKYMLLIYGPPNDREPTPEEWAASMPEWEAFSEGLRARGALVDAAPLAGVASATTVRVRDGKRAVTDGPFAETKEILGGYYIVEAPSIDGALEAAAMCPGAKYGSVEVRPVVDVGG
ncbi:MAG TPA: YciI family protein [Candidatus Elarobacter sp.]|nr:YciI family protein [Candidatus Elarobacter sp.]